MTIKAKQVVFNQYGSPDVLQLVTTDMPQPSQGEVLIKTLAIGVNYSDVLRRRNTYFQATPLPFVLGSEVVGEIVSVGNGVGTPFIQGTKVLAILPFGGGYADYVTAIAQYCIPIPENISPAAATGIFVQGSTAQLMVSQLAGDMHGKTVLINTAAGGVGSLLVQLAKLNGATVIAAASTDDKLKIAKKNGADFTVNYSQAGWSKKIKDLTNGKGADVAFEMVGGDVYNETIRSLSAGAHIIVYGCASGVQGNIHPEHFVDENLTQSGFNLSYYINNKMPLWQEVLGNVISLLAQGKITVDTPNTFALEDAAEAHKQIETRRTTGKVVLTTQ